MQADQYVFISAMYTAVHIDDNNNDTLTPICRPEA